MRVCALTALLLWPLPAWAASVRVLAYDDDGRLLDTASFLRHIAPAAAARKGVAPDASGLFATDLQDEPVPGRPWCVADSTTPAWAWTGPEKVQFSLPWPVPDDGFSTVQLDGEGSGYVDGQTLLLNEEAAKAAWRRLREAVEARTQSFTPRYAPGKDFQKSETQAKAALVEAQASPDPRRRARLFDKALSSISRAWQVMLFEHGRQAAADPKVRAGLRFGLTLEEALIDRLPEHQWIAGKLASSGADWVRLVFRPNPEDPTYAQARSFPLYDGFLRELKGRGIKTTGVVLDASPWPKGLDAQAYAERARNLVSHYKGSIRSWEVASKPNATWVGSRKDPLSDETVLSAVLGAASEAKRADPEAETVATLYWWEGTAQDDRRALFPWLKWSLPKGFGKDVDVVGLSIYPDENPMGLAFDTVFLKLRALFPDKKLMLADYGFAEQEELTGYWWLEPGSVAEARKDIVVLFSGAACALPQGVGGGFFYPTLQQLLAPGRKPTLLFGVYRSTLGRLKP